MVPAIVVGNLLLRKPWFARILQPVLALLLFVVGGTGVLIAQQHLAINPAVGMYYVPFLIVHIFNSFLLVRLRLSYALAISLGVVVSYAFVITHAPAVAEDDALRQVLALANALVFAFGGGYLLEAVFRRNYRAQRIIEQREEALARERARSETLLLNILPPARSPIATASRRSRRSVMRTWSRPGFPSRALTMRARSLASPSTCATSWPTSQLQMGGCRFGSDFAIPPELSTEDSDRGVL